jgi:hypothetical protein
LNSTAMKSVSPLEHVNCVVLVSGHINAVVDLPLRGRFHGK